MKHSERVQEAIEAIRRVFSDTSVSPEQTRESLSELKGECETGIDCINSDLDQANG